MLVDRMELINNAHKTSNFYSQTLLFNTKIDFKSEKDFDDEIDDDFSDCERIKKKYKVLSPDHRSQIFSMNGFSSSSLKLKSPNKNGLENHHQNSRDDNQLGEPKRILYSPDKIILVWKKPYRIGAGLANLGNTCFMNSVLQCLTYCPPFVNYLLELRENNHSINCKISFCIICLMIKHVTSVFSRENSVIEPNSFRSRLRSIANHFIPGRQEDAHEFLRYVIDHMWRACLSIHELESGIPNLVTKSDQLTKATTAINHIFGGYHQSQVTCLQCKSKSNTYDYFMDFMLEIQNVTSLEQALKNFVNPEILRNENAYKCMKCKKSVVAKKQFTVYRAPIITTFQLKRFECVRTIGKIMKAISYPEVLDLRPYMSENGPPLMYKLISVLVHDGHNCNSGHYYCYVRNSNNFWYKMDDSSVLQVNINQVLNQKAYLLFYIQQKYEKHTSAALTLNSSKSSNQSKVSLNDIESNKDVRNHSENNIKTFNSSFTFDLSSSKPIKTFGGKRNVIEESNHHIYSKVNEYNNNNQINHSPLTTSNSLFYKNLNKVPIDRSCVASSNHVESVNPESSKKIRKISPTTIKFDSDKQTLPILKMKATTNSWQVVKSENDDRFKAKNAFVHESQSNTKWKIVRNDHTFENNEEDDNLSNNQNSQALTGDERLNSNNLNRNIGERKSLKKLKKNKRKKRKKDKVKKRISASDDVVEWIERTKETLELENSSIVEEKKNDFSESSSTSDPKPTLKRPRLSEVDASEPRNSSKSFDILDALLKKSSYSYEDVKTWNGDTSNIHKSMIEDMRSTQKLDFNDRYNEEFDQGKVTKLKSKMNPFNRERLQANPFQAKYNTDNFENRKRPKFYHNHDKKNSNNHFSRSIHGGDVNYYTKKHFKSNHRSNSNTNHNHRHHSSDRKLSSSYPHQKGSSNFAC
ncbi:Down syndrome critical region protein 3-like protein [Sarcoptes scabiei]|nr:Down syndrome critical region protein 3-like protein [Sarcoptes scabiei]